MFDVLPPPELDQPSSVVRCRAPVLQAPGPLPCPEAGLTSVSLAHIGFALAVRIAGFGVSGEGGPPDVFVTGAVLGDDEVEGVGEGEEYYVLWKSEFK